MSDSSLYVGLDIGTSGARAVALDSSGQSVAVGYSQLADHGSDRTNPASWWAAASVALETLCSQLDATAVKALAVGATSGTVLAVNPEGRPVSSALMYNDTIEDSAILDAIAALAPPQSAVHGASSALARAISLQQTPDCSLVLHQADWIAGCISGNFTTSDESNSLKTGYDPISRQWPDWLAGTGMQLNKLPTVVAAGTRTGTIKSALAAKLGLSPRLAVIAGVTDGCASFLATGAANTGDCVTALGSTLTMKMLCDAPIFNPDYGIYSHRIGDQWLAGGASNSGGAVLEHFFSIEQIRRLSAELPTEKDSGLNYYPLIKRGERFPHNDANWPAVLEPRPQHDLQFLHGLLEGMARIEQLGYQRLHELGAPRPTSVRSVGGGAQNPAWQAIRQRINPVPFAASLSIEAAAGSARLALQAMQRESA